jgi:hypothetical protein
LIRTILFLLCIGFVSRAQDQTLNSLPFLDPTRWHTDFSKLTAQPSEFLSGGPGKDGIPALNQPIFETFEAAQTWLEEEEPVIALQIGKDARAYPLQILMWHELVNDVVANQPVLISFCPLCHAAVVFSRNVAGQTLNFGVSGLLRKSDMVMFDRATDSLWQQFTGEALAGTYVGSTLAILPSQILSFRQFQEAFPEGLVLSQQTGYQRNYGTNPYPQYDRRYNQPFLFKGEIDKRLPPMERVISIAFGNRERGYPFRTVRKRGVIQENLEGEDIVIFHLGDTRSALSSKQIRRGRKLGSIGVFSAKLGDRSFRFERRDAAIVDLETGSSWSITGKAIAGPLQGKQLAAISHRVDFAFAWFAFAGDRADLWQD